MNEESALSCAKPKFLRYLSEALELERLPITEDLSIVRTRSISPDEDFEDYVKDAQVDPARKEQLRSLMLEKLDSFLASHRLEARLPKSIVGSDVVPRALLDSVPRSVTVPLTDSPNGNGKPYPPRFDIAHYLLQTV